MHFSFLHALFLYSSSVTSSHHSFEVEILWIDIHTTSDESEYITQLQLPIA